LRADGFSSFFRVALCAEWRRLSELSFRSLCGGRIMPYRYLLGALLMSAPGVAWAEEAGQSKWWVYVGTYTDKSSKGIYRFDMDAATGKLTNGAPAAEMKNPSFLAIHPNRRFLYAVGEVEDIGGKKGGGISAFAIDPKTGDLKPLNQQSSGGPGPCHLVVDKSGKCVLAANYGGGSAVVVAINEDGSLGKQTDFVQHKGHSVNKSRQEAPHAHSINLDPANRFAFVADLGLDAVRVYRFNAENCTLDKEHAQSAAVSPGAGPRHFAFHPNGKFAYVINELHNTVTAFSYDPEKGELKKIQTVSTLPKDFTGESYTAEVVVHPSGRFLYGSKRGHNSIALFRINADTGELTPAGHQAENIKTPRNFNIDPTGKFCLVANQDADSIVVFAIDAKAGELKPTGISAEVPVPVCVKFVSH
jgi:6-phosphogluconolactonase